MASRLFKQSLSPEQPDAPTVSRRFTRTTAIAEAVTDKLVRGIQGRQLRENEEPLAPPTNIIQEIVQKTASSSADARNQMQLLPDIELAKQILISSILSPNDMMSTELTYSTSCEDLGDLTPTLLTIIKDYFNDDLNIRKLLPEMLERILFLDGSYPILIMPESSVDDLINSRCRISQESLDVYFNKTGGFGHYGVLGNATANAKDAAGSQRFKPTMESYNTTQRRQDVYNPTHAAAWTYLDVTDNIDALKFPMVHEKIRQDALASIYDRKHMSFESFSSFGRSAQSSKPSVDTLDSMYRPRTFQHSPVLSVKTLSQLEKETVGHPLMLTLPSECVIPVYVPSNPQEHLGYFVAVDRTGNPVSSSYDEDFYQDMSNNAEAMKDMSSQMLASTRKSTTGMTASEVLTLDEMSRLHIEVVERDLLERLKNGIYGDNVKIGRPQEAYRIMLARAFERMYTQLVYVPSTLLTYMAFDYNSNGIGVSLLESTKMLGSIRAMLLFANTMASIKNSINHTSVNVELDPDDPDPYRTVTTIFHEYARTRQSSYPIAQSNPQDIVNYLQAAGVEFNISGHPRYPETKTSIESRAGDRVKVDTDLDEMMKKRHLMALGIAPETVDLSMGVDFATSVVSSNILLAKRALIMQEKFTAQVSQLIQMFTYNSQTLMDKIRKTVNANRDKLGDGRLDEKVTDDQVATLFVNTISVSLPEPDMSKIEMQMEAFEIYSKGLDTALAAFVSEDLLSSDVLGTVGEKGSRYLINVLKAYYQRQWLQSNNVLPELFDLVAVGEGGEAVLDVLAEQERFLAGMASSLLPFIKKTIGSASINNKIISDYESSTGLDENPSSGGDSGGGEESDGGGDEEGGGDDFGDDFGDEGEDDDSSDGEADDDSADADSEGEDSAADDSAEEDDEADA